MVMRPPKPVKPLDMMPTQVRTAVFSQDLKYRYLLSRRWAYRDGNLIVWVMLNPSTANDTENDPTIERCMRRSIEWGYAGMDVVNLYAFRATSPANLFKADDPVGPMNEDALNAAFSRAEMILLGWGAHARHTEQERAVLRELAGPLTADKVHFLKIGKGGAPSHPLYLPYTLKPRRYFIGMAKR